MDWHAFMEQFWPHIAAAAALLAGLLATGHVLLSKRDSRAATIWIIVIWTLPVVGSLLYLVLGVNRIRRRAIQLGIHKTLSRPVP
jgi:cardiolipin synthase